MASEVITGTVTHITYTNESNGYTVCDVDVDGVLVCAVGAMPSLVTGESVRLTGEWTVNPSYGEQFAVSLFEHLMPKEVGAVLTYLSSGIIKGIGAATARRIVDMFGSESLDILAQSPERLTAIKGISRDKALSMHASFMEKRGMQDLILFLQPYGVSVDFAMRAYKALGASAADEIRKNPYVLCDRISGIGFDTADKIAKAMDVPTNAVGRVRSGIRYTLLSAASQMGHTYLPESQLTEYAARFLEVDEDLIFDQYAALLNDKTLFAFDSYDEGRCLQLAAYKNAETSIARKLSSLRRTPTADELSSLDTLIAASEKRNAITLSEEQHAAVAQAVFGGVTVITGGPGTGKTTIIRTILDCLSARSLTYCLAAPTGRAAKRMADACEAEAKTIHRLLEIGYASDELLSFARDETNPIDSDFVIVDEVSMVDTLLMASLMKAIAPGTGVILLGDADQLPSVGAGSVLKDIIQSGAVVTLKLTHIYRQAAESMIVTNAHRINSGEIPRYNKADNDFFLVTRQSASEIADTVVGLCAGRLTKAYGFDPMSDIQVVTPVKKSLIGVFHLNALLQNALNPQNGKKAEHRTADTLFREGDKVMQTENDYDMAWTRGSESGSGIYNGDMGRITSISKPYRAVTVLFDDGRTASYPFDKLNKLMLAYAITVHKSQGSEFPCIVMPVYRCAPALMTRNLFYTAVTRARSLVVLVGMPEAVETMVYNNTEQKRYSALLDRLS